MSKILRWLAIVAATLVMALLVGRWWVLRPAGGVTVERVRDLPAPAAATHGDFWSALRALAVDRSLELAASDDQRAFAGAVQQVAAGDLQDAARGLQSMFDTTPERQLRLRSGELLAVVLDATGQYQELFDLLRSEPSLLTETSLDRSNLDFGRVFATAPAEQWSIPRESSTTPLYFGALGIPEVEVEINGCRRRLILDTGASATVIGSHVAEACGVESLGRTSAGTSTSIRVEAKLAVLEHFAIADTRVRNHRIGVIDDADLSIGPVQLDGAVGWPVFARLRIEIDAPRRQVVVGPSGGRTTDAARNLVWFGYPYVLASATDGTPLRFEIDTGARRSSIMTPLFSHGLELGPVEPSGSLSIGVGGAERVSGRRIRDFTLLLAEHALTFDRLSTRSAADTGVLVAADGRLGSDIGRGAAMVLDYPAGRFELRVAP